MDLFQTTEATQWADKCYREELARAEHDHLASKPDRTPRAKISVRMLIAHPAPATIVMALLAALLVVVAV